MRLRLFERLGRLVGWRLGSQGEGSGRSRRLPGRRSGSRRQAPAEHRRRSGPRHWTAVRRRSGAGQRPQPPPLQPPGRAAAAVAARGGGGPRKSDAAHPARRRGRGRPCRRLPRNYTPRAGGGGGIGRARIREAPFGAAPMETATRGEAITRGQDGASQLRAARRPGSPGIRWSATTRPGAGGKRSRTGGGGLGSAPARPGRRPRATRAWRRCRSPPRIRSVTR